MLDKVKSPSGTTFSHVKPQDTVFRGDGLRDFFLYRDLGIAARHRRQGHRATRHRAQRTRKRHRLAPP